MSPEVALVTDSTAAIEALAPRAGWRVVPLELEIDGQRYREGPELTAAGFHRMLQEINTYPTTLPPSVEAFVEAYAPLLETHDRILSIHLSGELSRTAEHAAEAARRVGSTGRITVLDSRLAGAALGLLCLEAEARLAAGERLEETLAALERIRAATRVWFSVYTLDFLYLGGRLERAGDHVASHEDRPVLALEDGALALVERVVGETSRVDRMVELLERAHGQRPLVAACVHAGPRGEEAGRLLEERLRDRPAPLHRWHHAPLGPVLCAHTGFDVCGVAAYPAGLSAL